MRRKILVLGAGKSTAYLFDYFLRNAKKENLLLLIGDLYPEKIDDQLKNHEYCNVMQLDIANEEERKLAVAESSIVVSMLPARLHLLVAITCLEEGKDLVTASYISPELLKMNAEVERKGLIFMNEVGLDPGIDHMSAMEVIDRIRNRGGKILLFESFTGGLVAPENDDNLWHYKFTWNPRNVVLAGQGGAAKFIQEGTYKYIPYHKLFRRTEFLEIEGYGKFEAYANRDSLRYKEAYGLQGVRTLFRGTMRRIGFSKAWNMFVQLGMTDDSYQLKNPEGMSYRDFTNFFLPYSPTDSVELKLRHYLKIDQDDIMWEKLEELDLFNGKKTIPIKNPTPAQCLQYILEESWTLKENEKDMIVMYHKFGYEINGENKQVDTNMVVLGANRTYTAMAKTVGLPVGVVALHILNEKIKTPGVQIPISKEIYQPVLSELKHYGILFNEYQVPYLGYNPDSIAS